MPDAPRTLLAILALLLTACPYTTTNDERPITPTTPCEARGMAWCEVEVSDQGFTADQALSATFIFPTAAFNAEAPLPVALLLAPHSPADNLWRVAAPPSPAETTIARALAMRGAVVIQPGAPRLNETLDAYVERLLTIAAAPLPRGVPPTAQRTIIAHGASIPIAHRLIARGLPHDKLALLSPYGRTLRDTLLDQLRADRAAPPDSARAAAAALDALGRGEDVEVYSVFPHDHLARELVSHLKTKQPLMGALLAAPHQGLPGAPAVVLCGDRDVEIECDTHARDAAAHLDATLQIIPAADHFMRAQQTPRDELRRRAPRTMDLSYDHVPPADSAIDALIAFMERP